MTQATSYADNSYSVPQQSSRLFNLRTSALMEIGIFFLVALIIDFFFFSGNRFVNISPHPFWIIVVFISAKYGAAEGLVAAFASLTVLWIGNAPAVEEGQYPYAIYYDFFIEPALWILTAVLLGGLRARHVRERDEMQRELVNARASEETIAQNYSKLKSLKENLERRLASQFKTAVATYEAAKAIDKRHPLDVLRGVEDLVVSFVNPRKFSIFLLEKDALTVSTKYAWGDSDRYATSFPSNSMLFREIVGKRRVLSAVNQDDEAIFGGQGMLAGPLRHPTSGEVIGMLKVEDMNFDSLNLSTVESFRVLCDWISSAYVNAELYQQAAEQSIINPDNNLLSRGFFRRQVDYVTSLAKRVNFDASLVIIKLVDAEDLSEDIRRKAAQVLGDSVNKVLRKIDQAFDYHPSDTEFSIILPATSLPNAKVVVEKIMNNLQKVRAPELRNVQFTFAAQALHKSESESSSKRKK